MNKKEIELGEKVVSGKNVSLDEENLEKLSQMSKSLRQVEKNIKEKIISKMK